jgi:hypothetical protein
METLNHRQDRVWHLPPLILHPFSESNGPDRLVESSRANLMLQGLLPSGEAKLEDLERRLLDGRYCEIRMLYYVGKDVSRWVEQCLEIAERDDVLRAVGLSDHSFLWLLIKDTPPAVREKLRTWGVSDYQAIFTRAAALNTIFAEVPDKDQLSTEFIRNYYRYADQVFACSRNAKEFPELAPENFQFDLYASGEYSRILERSWEPI